MMKNKRGAFARSVLRDVKFYIIANVTISAFSIMMLLFLGFFNISGKPAHFVAVDFDLLEIFAHFFVFLCVCLLATLMFPVSRLASRFLHKSKYFRIIAISSWSISWTLFIYHYILVEGSLEPTPSITYPYLVIFPIGGISILALDSLLPLSTQNRSGEHSGSDV